MGSPSGSPTLAKINSSNNILTNGRRGRKLDYADDQRLLVVLPKDVPERTWLEVLHKEEQELFFFEIREEIVDRALDICYEAYMERQTVSFTVHCAAEAWLKLIDWHFFRHDPGEDVSAYPPCDIPNRVESWVPDAMPMPSPKDTYAFQALRVLQSPKEELKRHGSSDSLDYPYLEPIAPEYWFPGRLEISKDQSEELQIEAETKCSASVSTSTMAIASEILEKVTEYNKEIVSTKVSKADVGTELSRSLLIGDRAGSDAAPPKRPSKKKLGSKKEKKVEIIKSKISLAPLKLSRGDLPRPPISTPSNLRLRNLRFVSAIRLQKTETLAQNK